jgi:hypothetical protein
VQFHRGGWLVVLGPDQGSESLHKTLMAVVWGWLLALQWGLL